MATLGQTTTTLATTETAGYGPHAGPRRGPRPAAGYRHAQPQCGVLLFEGGVRKPRPEFVWRHPS